VVKDREEQARVIREEKETYQKQSKEAKLQADELLGKIQTLSREYERDKRVNKSNLERLARDLTQSAIALQDKDLFFSG